MCIVLYINLSVHKYCTVIFPPLGVFQRFIYSEWIENVTIHRQVECFIC